MENNRKFNILILSVQVPFTRGGAEALVESLRNELALRKFNVDIVTLPFTAQPKDILLRQIALWRALEIGSFAGRQVDLVIATKFPSYMVRHPRKVLWLVHQHRQLYELYGSRFGDFDTGPQDESLRRMVVQADQHALRECVSRFTISDNVSRRLKRYLDLDSQVLNPPLPMVGRYRTDAAEDYILSVGRLCSIKRVDLIIKAMPMINENLKLKIVGVGDEPAIENYLRSEVNKHHLWQRVEFLGRVDDETLLNLYAKSFAVYYAPYDEDYGFISLEALASKKPVITAKDSGTVLDFVVNERNGLIVDPDEKSIAAACRRLYEDKVLYDKLVERCSEPINSGSWDRIIEQLTSPLKTEITPG